MKDEDINQNNNSENQPNTGAPANSDNTPREDGPDTEKYPEMEQPGVSYTHDTLPTNYSDYKENGEGSDEKWKSNGENSRNSEVFNQDDYILNDNIDLDEDQNQSISSDDI